MTTSAAVEIKAAAIVIDVNDLEREATFWTSLLDSHVFGREHDWVDVARLGADGPLLSLQLVEERKAIKNRLHLDFVVDDFAAVSERALRLGATAASEVFEPETTPWQVFADPEGNEFCLITKY